MAGTFTKTQRGEEFGHLWRSITLDFSGKVLPIYVHMSHKCITPGHQITTMHPWIWKEEGRYIFAHECTVVQLHSIVAKIDSWQGDCFPAWNVCLYLC